MKLNVLERLKILQLLPQEGNFMTLTIVNKMKESLSLTEAEFKEFEVKEDGVQTTWNTKGQEEQELEIGEKASDIIAEALKKLNDEDKLTVQYMSVYEKFVEKK